ncbi:MAG TPA: NGG1p interacting factor NIF3 [bacterium]|nr:NGG1p interacting factor NIF3 [bacterium]
MNLEQFFAKAVQVGIDQDPRGRKAVEKLLKQTQQEYDKLDEKKKGYFDTDSLTNPFADSRFLFGEPETPLKRMLVGIDIEGPEVLLADRLRERGEGFDLVLGHHPEGIGLTSLHKVMYVQADVWHSIGVPISVAESLIGKRASEIEKRLLASNCNRAVDLARLLNIPLMCTHTPADNCVTKYLQKRMDAEKPEKVSDVIDFLLTQPEYQDSSRLGTGPKVILGSESRRAGRIMVDMTGGTGGPKEILERIAQTDVGTIVGMHMSEDCYKEAEKNHLNVVIAGHIASDNLGMNLLLDMTLGKAPVEVVECSGFKRVRAKERKTV